MRLCALICGIVLPGAISIEWKNFDTQWKFARGADPSTCAAPAEVFPIDLGDTRCLGLALQSGADTQDACATACCSDAACETWQFCPADAVCATQGHTPGCWTGARASCSNSTDGWISRARAAPASADCDTDFCKPTFDDGSWRQLELPHDWSAEDLPARAADADTPVLEARNGTWRFAPGDNSSWAAPDFDDAGWEAVAVPHDWRDPPTSYTKRGAYGWYRRTVTVGAAQMAAARSGSLRLALGTVVASDETFVNGVKVGGTGSMGKASCGSSLAYRAYLVPLSALAISAQGAAESGSTGKATIAVRVYSEGGAPGTDSDGQTAGGLFDSEAPDARVGMFDPGASPGQKSTGYTVGGEGWYRKSFVLPRPLGTGESSHIKFDGVYMNSDVWLNGKLIGSRPYGYVTFAYDLSASGALLPPPQKNVLAVRVRNGGRNSRWYSGSGIYRHVFLGLQAATSIPMWSLQARASKIDVAAHSATVDVDFSVAVAASAARSGSTTPLPVVVTLRSGDGSVAATAKRDVTAPPAGQSTNVSMSLDLAPGTAKLWSTDTPNLYSATVSLDGGASVASTTTFGIRKLAFSATGGFELNDIPTKLQGGCVHHDNGALGARAIDRAEERRVEILKANGYNAIRTSHNPVSPAFLDACDRLGMLVMDEAFDCWSGGKNPQDYHLYFDEWWQRDMEAMVLRDRNHPSIIMWSIGNEIPIRGSAQGIALAKTLSDFVRARDRDARPVTSAYPGVNDGADPFFASLEVAGYNYGVSKYVSDHARKPDRIMVGTESFPAASFENWDAVWDNSYVLGDFIWTAIDYIGESSIGANGANTPALQACGGYCPRGWDYHVAYCGDIDLVGHRKPQSVYRNVLWNNTQLEVAVHAPVADGQHEVIASWGFADERQSWTWPGTTGAMSVNVYSRHSAVQLTLNGKPADPAQPGLVNVSRTSQFTATFAVPKYAPGALVATAFDADGKAVESKTLQSAGKAAALQLDADRAKLAASRDDLSYVTATVVDAQGVAVPTEDTVIHFKLDGGDGAPCELAAVGSGDPSDTGSFHAPTRKTYRGRAVAIVRPGAANVAPQAGSVELVATADGLESASVTITFA